MKFIWRFIFLINMGFALALLCSYLAPIIDPRMVWIFQIFGLFYHFLLFINIVFIFFWIWIKKKYILVSILAIAVGVMHIPKVFSIESTSPDNTDIKIMTFNMSRFISWKENSGHKIRNENYIEFKNQLDAHQPDILILQEDIALYRDSLTVFGGYKYSCVQGSILLLSKFPLGPCHMERSGNGTNGYINTLAFLPQDTLNIFAVHLPSNGIGFRDVEQLKGNKIKEKKTWRVLGSTLKRYKEATKKRRSMADQIRNKMNVSPYRNIVAGDFNEVFMSNVYAVLSKGNKDAFVEAGNGFGITFKKLLHSLRIDYILVDDSMEVTKYEILQPSYSDHYPSMAHISLASPTINN